jgi:hypothetical protein
MRLVLKLGIYVSLIFCPAFALSACGSSTVTTQGHSASTESPKTTIVSYSPCLPNSSANGYCIPPSLVAHFRPDVTSEEMAVYLNGLLSTKSRAQAYVGIVFRLDYPAKELLVAWPNDEPVSTQASLRSLLEGSTEMSSVS